ncbi:MAG TPA: nucleotidyltransferase domain-containing protein [Turneriella sp.]|nr:nucleotidyltransferase domain-containing protein [Turneriella sp.]
MLQNDYSPLLFKEGWRKAPGWFAPINLLTTRFYESAYAMQLPSGINIPENTVAEICEKWGISKLELFGSALTANFKPDSDIDLLATFDSARPLGFRVFDAVDDFSRALNRKVDLVSRESLLRSQNKFRLRRILASARPIYERS